MAEAGWYPDPSGDTTRVRWFDGQNWTEHVKAAGGSSAPGSRGGSGKGVPWLPIVVVLVVTGLLVAWFLRPGSDEADLPVDDSTPTVSAWDETSSPTPPPEESQKTVACPRSMAGPTNGNRLENGRRIGGHLSFQSRSWQDDPFFTLPFTHDVSSEQRQLAPGWFSNLAVGALAAADGFDNHRTAARIVFDCFSSSRYYSNRTGAKILTNEEVTIDGKPGTRIVGDVTVSVPVGVGGDKVTIIVVDTGDPESLSFFLSAATLTDEANLKEVQDTEKTVRVEG